MLTMEQKQELVDTCLDRVLELDEVTGNLVAAQNAWEMATYTEDSAYVILCHWTNNEALR